MTNIFSLKLTLCGLLAIAVLAGCDSSNEANKSERERETEAREARNEATSELVNTFQKKYDAQILPKINPTKIYTAHLQEILVPSISFVVIASIDDVEVDQSQKIVELIVPLTEKTFFDEDVRMRLRTSSEIFRRLMDEPRRSNWSLPVRDHVAVVRVDKVYKFRRFTSKLESLSPGEPGDPTVDANIVSEIKYEATGELLDIKKIPGFSETLY